MSNPATTSRISLPNLFIASIATLFLEMTLIRWMSTEVRVFAYVQNLALIACFLGFGLGCYHAGSKLRVGLGIGSTLALVTIVGFPSPSWHYFLMLISELLTLSPDSAMWAFMKGSPAALAPRIVLAVAVITVMLLLLIGAMLPLGQYVARAIDEAEKPIPAYSVNLAGSLLGGWLLAGLSFLWTQPQLWFVVCLAFVLLLVPQARRYRVLIVLPLLLIPIRWHRRDYNGLIWSPYQKLELFRTNLTDFNVEVNNTGYMTLSHAYRDVNYAESSYDSPFKFISGRDRVLVVGAGGGNDVAAALRNGVGHVDAVEIDPAILYIGKHFHPDHPYDSKDVSVYINDARNYMRTTQQRYDAVIFGLLDSHTVASGATNIRLDNYVYTQESFREAMHLLKPGGVLVLKFEVRDPWLWMGDRFTSMLTELGGQPPVRYYAAKKANLLSASVFLTSNSPDLWERAATPDLKSFLDSHPPVVSGDSKPISNTSDDWPYVYHRSHNIPRTYLTIMVILLVIALVLFGRKVKVRESGTWHFLFLGAGFLCMETQVVTRSALYFGNTWMVNCFAISVILIVLLFANLVVEKVARIPRDVFFGVLLVSLVLNYLMPWNRLPFGVVTIGLLLYAAYSIPLFCAGVIFSDSFRKCGHPSVALGANLFGATLGGVSQNLSFIFGLKALLLVSAVFYAGAWLFARGATEPSAAVEPVGAMAVAGE